MKSSSTTVVPVAAAPDHKDDDEVLDKGAPSSSSPMMMMKPPAGLLHRASSMHIDINASVGSVMAGLSAQACRGVSFDNWNVLSDDAKRALVAAADKLYPPDGIDSTLWEVLDDRTKAKVREECLAVVDKKGSRGNVVRFFFDFTSQQASDYYDSSVSAMALICALLLTIPFSIGGYFDNTYFTALEAAFALCDGTLHVTLPYQRGSHLTSPLRLKAAPPSGSRTRTSTGSTSKAWVRPR